MGEEGVLQMTSVADVEPNDLTIGKVHSIRSNRILDVDQDLPRRIVIDLPETFS